ncbi:sigma-70 family RNA polymerase sigma factor [Amycolatopsis sp. cg5]|uniref:sigma-70 family RNA polymerase sigma factor n=1 Tax=Amycolatopsis sp. cg5 TaxID=3238802 RepID=UPI00352535D0
MSQSTLDDVLPLSPLQQGLLFHAMSDDVDVYTVQSVFELDGPIDVPALRAAAAGVLARHANLRAVFRQAKSGKSVQLIPRSVELPWGELELGDRDFEELLAEDRARRFDPAKPPLLRFLLVKVDDRRHRLVFTKHHILLDGWSMPLLMRDLFALYRGERLAPVTPYKTYLAWLAAQDSEAALAAWRAELDGAEPTMIGPGGAPGSRTFEARVDRLPGITANTLVQCAWAILLGQLTGRDDVVFGTVVAGRPAEVPGVETMVGAFINTLPVRVRLSPGTSVRDALAALQDRQAALLPYQHIGLSELDARDLFDTLVVFESYPNTGLTEIAPGLTLRGIQGRDGTHYPLMLAAVPRDGGLHLRLDYREGLFDGIDAIGTRLVRILESLAAQPDQALAQVETVSPAERRRVIEEWNDTATDLPSASLPELFEAQAARTPDEIAVVLGGTSLTYAELDRRANGLAHDLIARGVRAQDRVVLKQERSIDLVVSILGVLKAGAVYVPLDLRAPAARADAIVAECGAGIVLTDISESEKDTGPDVATHPDHLAYVMYTSGSTGTPKGVAVTHRSVAALAADSLTSCRSWLIIVARNVSIDRLRKRGRRPQETGDGALPQIPAPHCEMDRVVTAMTLHDAMAKLTPMRREILIHMYLHDLSHRDVAERLGIPIGTVKSRAHSALRALRDELGGQAAIDLPGMRIAS